MNTAKMKIGSGADPVVSLFRVTAVAPLETGRVAIGMTAPPSVVLVEADGTTTTPIGREGDGPGEYAGVTSVVPLAPDSLAVWDAERRRISVFTGEGTLRREVDLREHAPLSWLAAGGFLDTSGRVSLMPSAGRSFVLRGIGLLGPVDGVRPVVLPSSSIDADGVGQAEAVDPGSGLVGFVL